MTCFNKPHVFVQETLSTRNADSDGGGAGTKVDEARVHQKSKSASHPAHTSPVMLGGGAGEEREVAGGSPTPQTFWGRAERREGGRGRGRWRRAAGGSSTKDKH